MRRKGASVFTCGGSTVITNCERKRMRVSHLTTHSLHTQGGAPPLTCHVVSKPSPVTSLVEAIRPALLMSTSTGFPFSWLLNWCTEASLERSRC